MQLITKINQILAKIYSHNQQANLIYFESFHGKKYSDNPKAIYEYIQKYHLPFTCIWGVTKGYEDLFVEQKIPHVRRFSLPWLKVIWQARFWITNTRTKTWIPKGPKTLYLETWHGTPLKYIGLDIKEAQIGQQTAAEYRQSVLAETALWDVVLTNSPYTTNCFTSAFNLQAQQFLPTGQPRNDLLVQNDINVAAQIKQRLQLAGKRIFLYAPTWREDQKNQQGYKSILPFNLTKIAQKLQPDDVLLLRMHYLVAEQLKIPAAVQQQIIDVSAYPDMADLLLISDALITDYSSCFFDYALLKRPILFYMPDRIHYTEELRGLYEQDLEQNLPSIIVETEHDFYTALTKLVQGEIGVDEAKYQQFNQKYNLYETGTACQQVTDWLRQMKGVEK